MADFYRLNITFNPGSGTILINGAPPVNYYEEGTALNIVATLDSGWASIEWFGNTISLSTSTSFSVNMPAEDYRIVGVASGDVAPIDGYGLLFFSEVPDQNDLNTLRLEVYQDGYGGDDSEVSVSSLFLNFGDNEKDLTQTILGCSLDFTLVGENGDYDVFLTGDSRTFRVKCLRNGLTIFDGYLNPDFIEFDDLSGNQYYSFVAIDGLKGFDAFRVEPFIFPGGTSGVRNRALNAIIGSLNQTFPESKKVNFICDIHEDRMDDAELLFTQFLTPESSIFTDGERQKFVDGVVVWNETTSIEETIQSLLKPFICRVFQWDNEFWVVRVPDMYQNSMDGFRYLGDSDFDDDIVISNSTEVNCQISPKPRIRSGRVYSEFTAILNMGVLELSARGSVFEATFQTDNWFVATNPYAGIYILRLWKYIHAVPSGQPSDYPDGEVARIQLGSDGGSQSCKIWTTTTTAGLSDPNLSSIYLTTQNTGVGLLMADELVNKLSIELEYMVNPVRSGLSNTFGNHSMAFQVKVGAYYLRESSTPDVYEFTTTPAQCVFPIPNISTYNKVKITNVVIPTTDYVEVNIYQLILNAGVRHQFAIYYRNFKLSIEENQALTLSQLAAKGITTDKYTSVFKDYEINIGDTRSNMSTSAIKLAQTGIPVSELWTAKDFTSLPLLGAIVQDLANLYGRTNRVLSGTIYGREMKPYQSFIYDGSLWVFLNFKWNLHRNSYEFEAFELGVIPSS